MVKEYSFYILMDIPSQGRRHTGQMIIQLTHHPLSVNWVCPSWRWGLPGCCFDKQMMSLRIGKPTLSTPARPLLCPIGRCFWWSFDTTLCSLQSVSCWKPSWQCSWTTIAIVFILAQTFQSPFPFVSWSVSLYSSSWKQFSLTLSTFCESFRSQKLWSIC